MLLTGKQLARIVSRTMIEAPMREPEELLKHRHVVFYRRWKSFVGEFIELAYYDRSQLHAYDPSAKHTMDPEGSEPVGRIKIIKPRRHSKDPPCDDTWNVDLTDQTRKGWGPMLYQLAIELATLNGGKGLMPDRYSVSADATAVWQRFMQGASDGVQAFQMDSEWNTLTPDPMDNCDQHSTIDAFDQELRKRLVDQGLQPNEEEREFINDVLLQSPLSKRYTRPPITLSRLIQQGSFYEMNAKPGQGSVAFRILDISDLEE
jgi:hypothetical protein